jgi:hypothetical protein
MEQYDITDFPLGLLEDKLKSEIAASAIVEDCTDVSRNVTTVGESTVITVSIYFTSALSPGDKTLLNGIVAAHVPPPARIVTESYTTAGSALVKHQIGDIVYTYVGSQSNEIHISRESQGHFSSIKAAIAANPGQNKVFIVHPGDYVEDNPINVEAGTVLISCGNAENTFITAQNSSAAVLNYNVKCKILGFTFRGGSVGIYFNQAASGGMGRYSAVMECFIVNCMVGIECDGLNVHTLGGMADTLYAREIVVSSTVRALDKGIYARRGGQFISAGVTVFGVPPIGGGPALPIMYGYYGTDAVSKFAMSISNCYFCGVGFYLDAGCSSEMTLLTLKYNGNGVIIGSGAGPTRFSVNSLEVFGSVGKDLTVLNTGALIEVHSGVFDDTKILNPTGVRLNMRYHTNKNGKTRQRMLGIINVGTPTEPAKMIIGEGSYDVYSLKVLRCTDGEVGTWSDVTEDALEDSGLPFGLFAGVEAGNCLYIGRDKVPIGVKISVLAACTGVVALHDLAWEYWNGTEWIGFHIMQTETEEPFWYVESSCISAVGSYHLRFGLKSNAPLVAKTLNGVSKKWIRVRVVHALPSVPTSEYILAHTHSTKIGSDGFTEYYGDARTVKKLTWNLYDMTSTGGVDQTVYFGKKLYSGGSGNHFPTATDCTISLSAFVPTDLDNSFPLKVILSAVGSVTGDVTVTFRYNFSNAGTTLHLSEGAAPAVTTGEKSVVATVSMTAGVENRIEAHVPICHVNMNPSGLGPQTLWFCIDHPAADTYAGSLTLTQISGYYVSWIDGAHLLAF